MRNPLSSQARAQRRLGTIRERVQRLRAQVAELEEQIVHLTQVEADAQTDAVVAGHQVAAREHRAARSDLDRAVRQRDEAQATITGLLAEQDSLLERLLD